MRFDRDSPRNDLDARLDAAGPPDSEYRGETSLRLARHEAMIVCTEFGERRKCLATYGEISAIVQLVPPAVPMGPAPV